MSLACHREKIKLDEVEFRSPSFDRFSFLLYVNFYNFTAAGIWVSLKKKKKKRLMNYPTETEHEAMGQRQRTEDHGSGGKGYLCKCFCLFVCLFFFLLSYIPHVSMYFEKSRRLSVL